MHEIFCTPHFVFQKDNPKSYLVSSTQLITSIIVVFKVVGPELVLK